VDRIVAEPNGGAHRDAQTAAANLKKALIETLATLDGIDPQRLVADRYDKFRRMGAPPGLAEL
jgi:acetyl-CoA carboxylase carboxyl transferase subunit alpha